MSVSQVMNEAERPRVLIMLSDVVEDRFNFLQERPGTIRSISTIGEVDPQEWDIIITDESLARHDSMPIEWWIRDVPLGLHVFLVHRENMTNTLDLATVSASDEKPTHAIQHKSGVPGNAAYAVESLDEGLQRLVKKVLVPLMGKREYQWGHVKTPVDRDQEVEFGHYVPFVTGPADTVIAAHYSRGPKDCVWLVPADVPDFEPWWDAAIDEWHELTPKRIPGLPRWQRSKEWMTLDESELAARLDSERAAFLNTERAHLKSVEALESELYAATQRADTGERALLTGQGDELQQAVLDALSLLGFSVEDMDRVWDPKARREDFRITDSSDEAWFVIADATGTTGGTPGSKLQSLSTYVNKYMLEEKPNAIPGQWLISNQFIGRDPAERREVLRGDDLRLFAEADGLAIDTAALYVLQRSARGDEAIKEPIREWLRTLTGQLTVAAAKEWLFQ